MDAHGARLLAARIRAGVWMGMRIEVLSALDDDSGLCAGDRGVVGHVQETGCVVVHWDRGFTSEIDPERTRFVRLAA